MALESFASIVAEQVLEKLASNAYQELSTAWGVEGELKKLEGILKTVSAVLLDAEEKQVNNHQLRVWLDMLKDVLYDAEDVLDEFECETQRKQVLKLYGTTTKKEGKDDQDLARFRLQKLELLGLPKLVEFPEWLLRGSTNTLQLLVLRSCKNLKELPACLQNIASLQKLEIGYCAELSGRCERGKGEDWSKIAHIPNIILDGSEISSTGN